MISANLQGEFACRWFNAPAIALVLRV